MKQKPAYEDLQREVESLQQKIAEIKMGKKFLSFFENNKAAMLEIDAETKKIVNANPQALLFYGYSKEEFLKKSIYDLQTLPPEEVNVLMKKAINSPANYFEFRHKLANGEIKDVQVFQSTFHFEDNIHFVATVNDITESLKNQFDLIEAKVIAEESRKYLDNIINSIGDPVFVKDDDSRLLLVNDAFCEIFGLSRENIIGKTLAEDVTPEEQEIFLRIDKQVLKDGKENINEEQLTVRGGETRTISTRKSRFIDSYGNKFLVGAIRDITERKKIEEALRESEERFKMLFEKAPLGYQSLDIEGNLIEVNDTWSETLGFSKNEALGKWFGDFLTAPSRDAFRERFKAFKSMGKVHVVFEMIKKDGSVGIYSIYGRIGHTPTGEFKQTHCVLTDITERRKAEDALAKVNNQKSLILNSAGEGIIGLNLNGEHTFFNQSALNLLGYSEEEFSGKNSHTLWHHQTISGEKISMEKSLIQDTLKTGKSHRVIDEVFWRKDGSYIPVEYIVSPVYEDNQLAGAVVTFSDISIRKKAEEKIKELSQAVEQSPASIVITNLKGEIEYTNPKFTEITGYSPDEALGKNPRILKSGETSRDEYEKLWSTIASGKDWRGTFHNIKKNGELYWESASISPIRNYEGKITHFLAIKEDITERIQKENELREAKEKAEESDRLKSAFLANMSHEIRTPMNGILGFAELLNNPGLTREKQQKYISVIEKSGVRMLNIINDIISISKIESGQMEIVLQESNINEQLEFISTFFKPEIEKKGIKYSCINNLNPKDAILKTDTEKVYAILTNLVKNAVKFCDKGSIELGASKRAGCLEFYVKDTGIGIPKDRQDAIFERFIQADISDKMARQGAGLGLAISKSYVEMLGGKIWVESEEGKGSVFYFTLPFLSESGYENNISTEVLEQSDITSLKKLKILIAEDDETSKELVSLYLEKIVGEILIARTGTEAVEVCRKNPDLDLVLMDIQMPGQNGYIATREIRKFNKDIIIIAQTAYGLGGDRENALEAGCNEYIAKPVRAEELVDKIKECLKKK